MTYRDKKPYKSFLIDPFNETVTEVMTSDLDSIYRHLQVDTIDIVYMNDERDGVFVDDNGLLNRPTHFFYVNGLNTPLAGRGLVCGCNDEGDSIAPRKITKEWLEANTVYIQKHEAGVLSVAGPMFMADTVRDILSGNHLRQRQGQHLH